MIFPGKSMKIMENPNLLRKVLMSHASGIQDYQRSKTSFPEAEACCSEMLRAAAKKNYKEVAMTFEQARNKKNKSQFCQLCV